MNYLSPSGYAVQQQRAAPISRPSPPLSPVNFHPAREGDGTRSRINSNNTEILPRSPQMIRCSDCSSLVPLLELSDHVCSSNASPSSSAVNSDMRQRQLSANNAAELAQQQHHVPHPRAHPGTPLRVDVSQAQNGTVQDRHMPLPSAYPSPSPHSPGYNSPSPSTSPAALSPRYPYQQQADDFASEKNGSNGYRPGMTRSNSAQSNLSALSDEHNNAGIGAASVRNGASKLPFFEKYNRVYGTSSSSGSISSTHSSNDYNASVATAATTAGSISPKQFPPSPASPSWSARSASLPTNQLQPRPGRANDPRQPVPNLPSQRSNSPERQNQQQGPAHHRREESISNRSTNSRGDSDIFNYMNTPETSPDVPHLPVFPSEGRQQQHHPEAKIGIEVHEPDRASSRYSRSTRRAPSTERNEDEGNGTDEDDIIDSYPTPMQEHHRRFSVSTRGGSFDLEEALDSPLDPHPPYTTVYGTSADSAPKSPLLQSFGLTSPLLSQATRSISRGLPMSHSTPDSLARLAAEEEANEQGSMTPKTGGLVQPSLSLNHRRRSKSSQALSPLTNSARTQSPAMNGGLTPRLNVQAWREGRSQEQKEVANSAPAASTGLGLDACLDDLLKEMNRESLNEGKEAPSPSASTNPLLEPPSTSTSSKLVKACESCKRKVGSGCRAIKKDGQIFCTDCYAELYLPKCRKCRTPIEGKAIGSGDGKVKGKFHAACFSCFSCSAPFPTGDFYVYDQRPYCARHYHELNGTLCANPACEKEGIEGPCVSLAGEEGGNGGRYHPSCFSCADVACETLLDQYHYVLNGLPYCESHAQERERELEAEAAYSGLGSGSSSPTYASSSDPSDAYYDVSYSSSASTAANVEPRRRSRSVDAPLNGTSISALRKNSNPSYSRARRAANQGQLPPPAASSNANRNTYVRRAEKRRTVVQDLGRRI